MLKVLLKKDFTILALELTKRHCAIISSEKNIMILNQSECFLHSCFIKSKEELLSTQPVIFHSNN